MKFATRLTLYYLVATLFCLALVGVAILKGIEYYGMAVVEKQLIEQSDSATVYITQTLLLEKLGPSGLHEIAGQAAKNLSAGKRQVRIYDRQLQMITASVDGVTQEEIMLGTPDVQNIAPALQGNYAYHIRNNRAYFASPIELQGQVIGVLEFVYPLDFLNQVLASARTILSAGAVGFALLITLLSISIARKVVKPIQQLLEATNRFAGRDFTPIRLERSDELGQLSRSFSDMGNQLQDYLQRQRQFVANVSHELRTPLTAIKGYSEYLIDEVKGRPDLEKAVDHLNNESSRLTRLVNELLLLSRIDEGREDFLFERVNVSEMVKETLDKLQSRAAKYKIYFQEKVEPDVTVSGDREKLLQGILNLLDNALKYSPPGGKVEVGVVADGNRAYVTVADRGRGIPPQELNKVFERFYRAANAKAVGGTGLGLAITQEIITAHHGKIQLANRQGGGTKVTVTLPRF
ncbi:sensor histidine kinase [Desulfotomaculum sp. 1211_IL3151]|uniref:sensor histidine kinase n=1 Tax=Desulfotomaculum sp. 1211_IL3151 TaxID=3084055 RepID=UPI002FDB678F